MKYSFIIIITTLISIRIKYILSIETLKMNENTEERIMPFYKCIYKSQLESLINIIKTRNENSKCTSYECLSENNMNYTSNNTYIKYPTGLIISINYKTNTKKEIFQKIVELGNEYLNDVSLNLICVQDVNATNLYIIYNDVNSQNEEIENINPSYLIMFINKQFSYVKENTFFQMYLDNIIFEDGIYSYNGYNVIIQNKNSNIGFNSNIKLKNKLKSNKFPFSIQLSSLYSISSKLIKGNKKFMNNPFIKGKFNQVRLLKVDKTIRLTYCISFLILTFILLYLFLKKFIEFSNFAKYNLNKIHDYELGLYMLKFQKKYSLYDINEQ